MDDHRRHDEARTLASARFQKYTLTLDAQSAMGGAFTVKLLSCGRPGECIVVDDVTVVRTPL